MSSKHYAKTIDTLTNRQGELVELSILRATQKDPLRQYTPYQMQKIRQDTAYNLQYLAESLLLESDDLWENYVRWLSFLLQSLGISKQSLARHFDHLGEVLAEELDSEGYTRVRTLLHHGKKLVLQEEITQNPGLDPAAPLYEQAQIYKNFLLTAQKDKALAHIRDLAEAGTDIRKLYLNILQPVQREIGNLWHANKISVAQEHYSTGLTQLAIAQLYPRMFSAESKHHRMIGACVSGELHEIGLRMITDIMELDGWDTHYLGANMPSESIVQSAVDHKIDLIAISVTFPLNLHKAEDLISAIRNENQLKHVKIMVGGYPFINDPGLWMKIGADSTAADASLVSRIATSLVEKSA